MTDSSAVPATTDRITELLADHRFIPAPWNPYVGKCAKCSLSDTAMGEAVHRAHVASLLANLMADSCRELAAEIVSDGPKHPYNPDETVRINAWCAGLHFAAAIVRGEQP